jgi:Holliday junction resolvasome RuvABC endonuclease subunit
VRVIRTSGPVIVGVDPALRNLGWVRVRLVTGVIAGIEVLGMGVISTEPSSKKRHVLASDDNLRSIRELDAEFDRMLRGWGNGFGPTSAIVAESMSFPRNSSAAAKVALSWGMIGTRANVLGVPVVQASPQEVRKGLDLAKNASKDVVREAILRIFEKELTGHLKDVPEGKWNHAFDALAVVLACQQSDVIRALRAGAR